MRAALACLALGVAAAGCAAPGAAVQRPLPPVPSSAPGPAPSPPACGDPLRSAGPPDPMPVPGAMPAGSYLRTIQERGRLVAGVSGDRLLLGSLDPASDQLQGFEIDLLREVARAIFGDDQHLELRAVTEAEALDLLGRGELDVAARQLAITCAARQRADFSTPYLRTRQRVLVPRDSAARGIEDLRGKQVCAAAGSLALAGVATAGSHPIPVPAPDWNECLVLFQQGDVDAISADEVTLLGFTLQDPSARIAGGEIAPVWYGLATAAGQGDLVRLLNGVLAAMRADGRWTSLYERWLGRLGPAPAPPAAEYAE